MAETQSWRYTAQASDGSRRTGELRATDEAAAIAHLRAEGLRPVELSPASNRSALAGSKGHLSSSEHARLMRSLADLVTAAIPVRDALAALARRETKTPSRMYLERLTNAIDSGESLSRAMVDDPSNPPRLALALVKAGEASGRLGAALERLADDLDTAQATRAELTGQLIYPAAVMVLFFTTLFLLSYWVLPQFEPLFRDASSPAPPETAVVLAVGAAIRTYGHFVVLGALVAILLVGRVMASRPMVASSVLDKLIFVGRIRATLDASRYAGGLALLLDNGETLARAEPTARGLVASAERRSRLEKAAAMMRDGTSPSAALREQRALPEDMIGFFELGERTGELAKLLNRAAQLYDVSARRSVRRALDLLGPVLIASLGLLIASIIAAVMSGVLSLNEVVY